MPSYPHPPRLTHSTQRQVERYSKMHDLPRRLESSIKLCFTFQHQKRIGQDEEILVRACVPACICFFPFVIIQP